IDFVEKPFKEEVLVETALRALDRLTAQRSELECTRTAKGLIDKLTPREKEVLSHLMSGLSNKGVAQRMNVSPRTVEMHRSNLSERLGVKSLSEAVRLACRAGFSPDMKELSLASAGDPDPNRSS